MGNKIAKAYWTGPGSPSKGKGPAGFAGVPPDFAEFWRSRNVDRASDHEKLWNAANPLTYEKLTKLNQERLDKFLSALQMEVLYKTHVVTVWVNAQETKVAIADDADISALSISSATVQQLLKARFPFKLSKFHAFQPIAFEGACKHLGLDLLDSALLLTELDRHATEVAASTPPPAKKQKTEAARRESDDDWNDIELAGEQYLQEVDERLERVVRGLERPSIWPGSGPAASQQAALRIPEIGGRPNLLCKGLGTEFLTDQGQLNKAPGAERNKFLVGRSGEGKTRTLFEHHSVNFGLYFNRLPGPNLGPHDMWALDTRLDNEMALMKQELAEKSQKSRHTPLKLLSLECQEEILSANRKKAEKYLQAVRLARLRVLERLLEKQPDLAPLDWLFLQLNPHRQDLRTAATRRSDSDVFTPLFAIYAMGKSADVSKALEATEKRIFQKLNIGWATIVVDELQAMSRERKFKSSRDGEPPTDLVSIVMCPWNPSEDDRWQIIGSGSGLGITHIVSTLPSMLSKTGSGEQRILTSFKRFQDVDEFATYVVPLVGKERVAAGVMEEAFYWLGQGPARLTTDFVERLLMDPDLDAGLLVRDLRDWHRYGATKGPNLDALCAQPLWTLVKGFVERDNATPRPPLVKALDGQSYSMLQLVERVVHQYLLSGEEVVLTTEGEQQLVEAGIARLDRSRVHGSVVVARIREPLAIVTAIEVLSEGKGEEYLLQKWTVKQMGILRSRPSALGFVWEDCLVHQLQAWVRQPLKALAKHNVFGEQTLPNEFSEPGEFVPFKVVKGRLTVTERGERATPVVARAGDGTSLATWLRDSKGSLFFSPEQSAGSDLCGLARWKLPRRTVYRLCFTQAKLQVVVEDWAHAQATVVPESFYSCRAGGVGSEWREERKREVLSILEKFFSRKKTGTLQIIAAYPDKISRTKRKEAFGRVRGKDVLAIIDGGCPKAVWGEHLQDLQAVKGLPKT